MKIGITKLIPENIKPPNADKLAIYDGDTKVCEVDISKMQTQYLGTKLYSFGLLSDIHCAGNSNGGTATDDGNGNIPSGTVFHRALTYFENQGCSFACVSGDLTNVGFYWSKDDTEVYLDQFAEYKAICDRHADLPVYGMCGNHESYYGRNITENLGLLEHYTGHPLYYTVTQGSDLFVFLGEPNSAHPMNDESFNWLQNLLAANTDKRCFVLLHGFITWDFTDSNGVHRYVDIDGQPALDSGNPTGTHNNPLFYYWGGYTDTRAKQFINLIKQYQKVIVFHGHSHTEFECQNFVSNSSYSTSLGFKSVHIPSTDYTRKIVDGDYENDGNGSQGYICDVYENHIVLKGYSFQHNEFVPIAQYCVAT